MLIPPEASSEIVTRDRMSRRYFRNSRPRLIRLAGDEGGALAETSRPSEEGGTDAMTSEAGTAAGGSPSAGIGRLTGSPRRHARAAIEAPSTPWPGRS